jgi:AraC-like DNA-binding protein
MSLTFSLTNDEPLNLASGLPNNYTGTILQGADTSHAITSFGHIIVQEFSTSNFNFSKLTVRWKKPVRIKCQYHYDSPVFFSRTMLNNSLGEVVKGIGDIYLQSQQFSALTGIKWSGLILSEKAGEHHFVHFTWNLDFINLVLAGETYFDKAGRYFHNGLPERLTTTGRDLNDQISSVLRKLMALDFNAAEAKSNFDDLMTRYLKLVVHELKECGSVKRKMREADWFNINKAKKLIDYNLQTQFTTTELSRRVGVNEFKLKKLFPKVAGFTIEEYRKYRLLAIAAKKIVQYPDAAIKMFSQESGYTSVSTFTRAFNRMGCTPGELREETWDVKRLEKFGTYG